MCKAGFSTNFAKRVAAHVRTSSLSHYPGNWSTFCYWHHGRNISPWKAAVQQVADYFVPLTEEMALVSAINL